ncbi:kti12, chromatin associated [Ophidiomyces ophidiicola]|nr:kti12, chromatin associated [Ophidiomyces ophidiicola]KAI1927757.1 kti12, chromatin associated [Ophidiomyces ophidiicola]KAI2022115.1 kti12, chromatin associated [Ophidiomyces ophidiicola]KAI2034687.1 kti12, chromatin associated [Ophidiomyces ophidiicola]KAI2065591.1 kti12, chromatin associated [Ophidiomyces ophidiicola]
MPLIILTGYPCSGLTYRAKQLQTLLENLQNTLFPVLDDESQSQSQKNRYKIHVVASHDGAHPRTVYDTARSEKEARAVVYGRVKRLLGKDSMVIVDGMNYIKGWRYQLWCESKAAGTTCCVVHVGTPIDQCVTNNDERLQGREQEKNAETVLAGTTACENALPEHDDQPYPPELLQNLIFRYEEPSTSSRWDKPLFTVPWSDPTPPIEAIWTALTGQALSLSAPSIVATPTCSIPGQNLPTTDPDPANAPVLRRSGFSRPKITPHQATVQPPTTDPNALYALEKRTSEIITHIRNFTQSHPSISVLGVSNTPDNSNTPGISIHIPNVPIPLFIPSSTLAASPTEELAGAGGVLALPRLQRLRRQWVGMNRAYLGQGHGKGQGAMGMEKVGEAFVGFLNGEFETVE